MNKGLNDALIRLDQLNHALREFMGFRIGASIKGKPRVDWVVASLKAEIVDIEQQIKSVG
jgi:hypothetical protein